MSHVPYNVEVGMTDEPGDIVAFIRARLDVDETAAEFVDGLLSDLAPPSPRDPAQPVVFLSPEQYVVGSGILTEDRIRADVDAKRRRLDWLMGLEHDMAEEGFPTYSSCRILNEPGTLGDLEVGYCMCGLDGRRMQLLKFDAHPYAGHSDFRDEWRLP